MILAVLFALALATQDDVSRLLEQLRSDEFAEREAAQRTLERRGLPVLERLKAEAEKTSELDTKIRLKMLIEKIPKLAQLAQVYGPTRRITLSAKGEKLGEVLKRLETGLGEQIRGEGVDLDAPVTIELQDATLWEALDRVARVTRTHYLYRKEGVAFEPGEAPLLPVVYYEQFRISIAEVKRVDYRAPGEKGRLVVVVPEVRYQRELSPSGNKYHKIFTIDAMQDAGGAEVQRTEQRPPWQNYASSLRREYGLMEHYLIDPAVTTFSIAGKATINFAQEHREMTLSLSGEPRELRTADGSFKLAETAVSPAGNLTLTLDIEVPEAGGPDDRFRGAWVVDADGKRYRGIQFRTGRNGKTFHPLLEFPGAPKDSKTFVFRWAMGLHSVDVPFLLRDVKVP
jgi:hypothetical protein